MNTLSPFHERAASDVLSQPWRKWYKPATPDKEKKRKPGEWMQPIAAGNGLGPAAPLKSVEVAKEEVV